MNQILTGKFIAQKRKEKNLTQEQLAEKIGVSNKTVSKWETGKCMLDYSIIEPLCEELGIAVAELLDGEEMEDNSVRTYDDSQVLELIKRVQVLENQRTSLYGLFLMVMGIVLLLLHNNIGGSDVRDFISGILLGLSVGEMLVGVCVAVSGFAQQKK